MESIACSNLLHQSSLEFRETDGCQHYSSSSVLAAVNAQIGGTYEVKKEDCIGRVQERLGTALRRLQINDGVQFYLHWR